MLDARLEAMARGGIHDQLGGGFARYSVDDGWVVPHFEKMLYDNAQLVGLYARWGTPLGDRVAAGDGRLPAPRAAGPPRAASPRRSTPTARARRAASTSGPPDQLADVLGDDDGPMGDRALRGDRHVRARHLDPAAPPRPGRPGPLRRRTHAACSPRGRARVRPARDDKVVAAWNGLAIAGLCDAGRLLGREEYVDAALGAGRPAGRRAPRRRPPPAGVPGRPGRRRRPGVLEDHGAVAGGFLALVRCHRRRALARLAATRPARRRAHASSAPTTAASTTPRRDGERLVARPRDPSDNASPSGTSATIHALLAAHALTGDGRWRDAADEALATVAELGASGTALRRLVAGRGAGRGRRRAGDRGRRPAAARSATPSSAGPGPGRVRSWSSPTARTPGVPAARRAGRRSADVRRRTCVVATFVTAPVISTGRFRPRRWTAHLVCSPTATGGSGEAERGSAWGIAAGGERAHLTGTAHGPQTEQLEATSRGSPTPCATSSARARR